MGTGVYRDLAGFVAGLVLSAVAPLMPAGAAQADPMWREARSLSILSHVAATGTLGDQELNKALCANVQRLAAKGAWVPVACVGPGDSSLTSPGVVTLFVHAAVSEADAVAPGAGGQLLTFSIRAERRGALASGSAYFGPAPRVVRFDRAHPENPSLDSALRAALAEILPWFPQAPMVQPKRMQQ